MANSVTLHPDGYLYVIVDGDQTAESVQKMGEETKAALAGMAAKNQPLLIFDDITKLGRTNIPARKKVSELAKTLKYDRVAMVGDGSTMMRVGTNLMLAAIGKGDTVRYFDDRQAAVAWLTRRR